MINKWVVAGHARNLSGQWLTCSRFLAIGQWVSLLAGRRPERLHIYIACMATEEARLAAAASLRTLSHAFAAHDPEDDTLAALTATAAELTCRVLLTHLDRDGRLPGTFDAKWRPTASYSCVTGNAQTAAQWFRLARITGDSSFADGARRATRFLKSIHDCASTNPHVRGAVKGSHPIWGRYLFGSYPNWAAKFFMDALLMELAADGGHNATVRCW